jgi:hypothetical protein
MIFMIMRKKAGDESAASAAALAIHLAKVLDESRAGGEIAASSPGVD